MITNIYIDLFYTNPEYYINIVSNTKLVGNYYRVQENTAVRSYLYNNVFLHDLHKLCRVLSPNNIIQILIGLH